MSTRAVVPTVATPVPVIAPVKGTVLQRTCDCGQHTIGGAECGECKKKKQAPLQRHSIGAGGPTTAPPIVHDVLRSAGQPLDHATRAFLEPHFGHDFSQVRVHTDERAAASAYAVSARAYTVGDDIVFGAGQFAPSTESGRRLLAHELVHTVQQGRGHTLSLGALEVAEPSACSEREAENITSGLFRGGRIGVQGAARPHVARHMAGAGSAATSGQGNASRSAEADSKKKEPPKRPEIQGEAGIHRSGFGVFDSSLDRKGAEQNQPCRLTLSVNVKFNPQGPWPAGSFAKWQTALLRIVTNRWSFRFMLAPEKACADESCKSATAILRVIPVTTSANNVHEVTVNYVKPPNTRSNAATLYESDIKSPTKDLRRGHATAVHEAGHWLGLEHIHCNTDANECYGVTDEESADIMGRGEIVTERDYAPFVEAMERITGCAWRTVGHGGGSLFGSSWIGPMAALFGIGGAIGGALLGASMSTGAALGLGALYGALGAGVGALIGLGLNEVAR